MDNTQYIVALSKIVAENPAQREFASSLLGSLIKGKVSDSQMDWIKRLTEQVNNPPKAVGSLVAIRDALKNAKGRFPKIVFFVGEGESRIEVNIKWTDAASTKAKPENRDTGAITNTAPYGSPDNRFYGRISTDGELKPSKDYTPEIADALIAVAENPLQFLIAR